jgi:proteic killer suppression protein
MAIQSFRCIQTQSLFMGVSGHRFNQFRSVAERKLQMLDVAVELKDLRSPPGNRLELLSGSRSGEYSIRINNQWRICFVWGSNGPEDVEIVDYH